jgi:uncharacterized protein
MKTSLNQLNIYHRLMGVIFGIFLSGFAMACIYYANLGSDPITTLIDGITSTFGFGEGLSTTIVNITLLLFMLFFNRKNIQVATLISVLFLGLFMDVSLLVLENSLSTNLPKFVYLSLTVLGSGILGISIGFYLSFDLGSTPSDSVPLWIRDKFHIRYQFTVWIFYSFCLIIGVLLGGTFGFGTIVALIAVGPIADYTMRKLFFEPN